MYVCIYVYVYVYVSVCIFAIMKTMCPPGYYHSGFVATHALGHMIYCSTKQKKNLLVLSNVHNPAFKRKSYVYDSLLITF